MALWAQAERGSGQVALVSGEPGIGKSRLVQALAERVRRRSATVLRSSARRTMKDSILHPILERLQRAARVGRCRRARRRAGAAQAAAGPRRQATDGAVALLADLMAMPAAADGTGPQPDAQRKRELLFEALIGSLERLARVRPLLLVLEDAHWIDPTSLHLLDLVVDRMGGWAMLLVVTCRPEFRPDWRGRPHVACIEVRPIEADDAERLVKHIPGGADLADTMVRGIVARSDGVPLFIEELTKAMVGRRGCARLSRGTDGQNAAAVPSSLQASLMSRLDRIGRPRELARIAAAIGREFTLDQLSAVVQDRDPRGPRGVSCICSSTPS